MRVTDEAVLAAEIHEREIQIGFGTDTVRPWFVHWSGVWVGALTALAMVLVFGLGRNCGGRPSNGGPRAHHDVERCRACCVDLQRRGFILLICSGWLGHRQNSGGPPSRNCLPARRDCLDRHRSPGAAAGGPRSGLILRRVVQWLRRHPELGHEPCRSRSECGGGGTKRRVGCLNGVAIGLDGLGLRRVARIR